MLGQRDSQVHTQFLFCQRRAGTKNEDRGNFLTETFIGHTKDRCFSDCFMRVDGGFYFTAIHILSTTNHHVFCTVNDVDETISINTRNVTSIEPAVLDRLCVCFWTIQITLDGDSSSNTQNAHCVRITRKIIAFFIHQLAFQCRHQRATRIWSFHIQTRRVRRDDPAGLCHAITSRWLTLL